jgi:Reverse transcriptase (RNA-dependent DNA polymerase)
VTTKSSIRALGVLDQSGVYAQKVLCLTLGDLHAVRQRGELSEEKSEPIGMQKSAAGIVGTDVPKARTVGRRVHWRLDRGRAPAQQLALPFAERGREVSVGASRTATVVGEERGMERVVARGNLLAVLRRVQRHGGRPGIDGIAVEELPGYLREHWPQRREALLAGTYRPPPVKRVEIPKPGGGVRKLGIPTVLDRFIEQALLQVLQEEWDPTFSESGYGFRPQRSAHQAVGQAQAYIREGYTWVVDIDLEKFFDRVNHNVLLSRLRRRVRD